MTWLIEALIQNAIFQFSNLGEKMSSSRQLMLSWGFRIKSVLSGGGQDSMHTIFSTDESNYKYISFLSCKNQVPNFPVFEHSSNTFLSTTFYDEKCIS